MSAFPNPPEKLKFLIIAISLMIVVSFLMEKFGWDIFAPVPPPVRHEETLSDNKDLVRPRVVVLRNVETPDTAPPQKTSFMYEEAAASAPPVIKKLPKAKKPQSPQDGHGGKIALIIDDMGMTAGRDRAVVALSGPITLAYLPYAPDVAKQAQEAKAKGHELLIHTPMEPLNGRLDMGPIGLREGMSEAEFKAVLRDKVFPAFKGYIGINNHMGSRLTQDPKAMAWVMEELKSRGLAFVDSVTIPSSVAADIAQEEGVPFAMREVFLDHDESAKAVWKQLGEVERRARREGYVVAIGHPRPETIKALQKWVPELKERGFELVPVSHVLTTPHTEEARASRPLENQALR
ncbi:MAG: divergent polysaccharide deacetylase family protein [Alphaproteobacteria bacterium]|nr:divergent polysaccharide deacetylase family protein [Alphaproteobacteria bacterium]